MIIRSGLIKNKDTVDPDEFTKHWKDIHGPLARIVPLMRAYSQNHIKRTLVNSEQHGLHRVDGISQLRFDTVADMAAGMESPEQHACIVDIQSFLSDVTILIQEEGKLHRFGNVAPTERKLMYLIRGDDGPLVELSKALSQVLSTCDGSFRINRIVNRDFRVDRTVPAGDQMIDAVVEVFLAEQDNNLEDVESIEKSVGIEAVGAYEVNEHLVLAYKKSNL